MIDGLAPNVYHKGSKNGTVARVPKKFPPLENFLSSLGNFSLLRGALQMSPLGGGTNLLRISDSWRRRVGEKCLEYLRHSATGVASMAHIVR